MRCLKSQEIYESCLSGESIDVLMMALLRKALLLCMLVHYHCLLGQPSLLYLCFPTVTTQKVCCENVCSPVLSFKKNQTP